MVITILLLVYYFQCYHHFHIIIIITVMIAVIVIVTLWIIPIIIAYADNNIVIILTAVIITLRLIKPRIHLTPKRPFQLQRLCYYSCIYLTQPVHSTSCITLFPGGRMAPLKSLGNEFPDLDCHSQQHLREYNVRTRSLHLLLFHRGEYIYMHEIATLTAFIYSFLFFFAFLSFCLSLLPFFTLLLNFRFSLL